MIDLKPFCADPELEVRTKLAAPWSQGDWTYASNGHVMVRVARRADVPEVAGVPENAPALFAWRAAPLLAPFGGFCLPAAGEHDGEISVGLRGGNFSLAYVRLIAGLPQLQLECQAPAVEGWLSVASPELALRFAFGGEDPGEGQLMPLRWRHDRHLDLLEGDLLGAHQREGAA